MTATTHNNTLTGILIDPIRRSVAKVQVPQQDDGYYNKRMAELLGCEWIERVALTPHPTDPEGGVDMWIDEEGLLVQPNPRGYFRIAGYGDGFVFGGRGLLMCYDGQGNTTSLHPSISVDRVHNVVEWVDFNDLAPDSETLNPKHVVIGFNADGSEGSRQEIPCAVTRLDEAAEHSNKAS